VGGSEEEDFGGAYLSNGIFGEAGVRRHPSTSKA